VPILTNSQYLPDIKTTIFLKQIINICWIDQIIRYDNGFLKIGVNDRKKLASLFNVDEFFPSDDEHEKLFKDRYKLKGYSRNTQYLPDLKKTIFFAKVLYIFWPNRVIKYQNTTLEKISINDAEKLASVFDVPEEAFLPNEDESEKASFLDEDEDEDKSLNYIPF
jgi:transcriptional regulator with XRE-family HTH domain